MSSITLDCQHCLQDGEEGIDAPIAKADARVKLKRAGAIVLCTDHLMALAELTEPEWVEPL